MAAKIEKLRLWGTFWYRPIPLPGQPTIGHFVLMTYHNRLLLQTRTFPLLPSTFDHDLPRAPTFSYLAPSRSVSCFPRSERGTRRNGARVLFFPRAIDTFDSFFLPSYLACTVGHESVRSFTNKLCVFYETFSSFITTIMTLDYLDCIGIYILVHLNKSGNPYKSYGIFYASAYITHYKL